MKKFTVDDDIKKLIQKQVKGYIALEATTIKDVADILSKKYERSPNPSNISDRLKKGNIKYAEIIEIANVLGYEIEWKKV